VQEEFPANTRSREQASEEESEARRQVAAYCQSLVDIGAAEWRVDKAGVTELHLESGQAYLLGECGMTRLK
jgi:hypothetical protein